MPKFFVEAIILPEQGQTEITGPDARHIKDVLRLKPGAGLTICDGARTDLDCEIASIEGDRVRLNIKDRRPNDTEPVFFVTLYQGLPKGDKFDWIIQKSVELGVGRIVPLICERSIAKVTPTDVARKVQRWNRIALEAAKQCGRGLVPEVAEPVPFSRAITDAAALTADGGLAFIPFEGERSMSLRQYLEQNRPSARAKMEEGSQPDRTSDEVSVEKDRAKLMFLIGPEGGFSPDEMILAEAYHIQTVSLGRRILRTETASLSVLAMLGYHFDEF